MNLAYWILMKNSKQLNLSQLFLYPISGVVAESILYSPFFVFSWEFMEQSIPMKMRTSLCYERPFWKDFVELKELFLCIANKCIMWCTSIIYFCALPTNAILHLEHYKSCLFRWALFRQYFFLSSKIIDRFITLKVILNCCQWKQDIDGQDVSLSKFKGKALLIVNVASRWYSLFHRLQSFFYDRSAYESDSCS